jgi:hypothetical protein
MISSLNLQHGGKRDRKTAVEFHSWRFMIERCYDQASFRYANYGGRGITVCNRWRGQNGYANFIADMGPRPNNTPFTYSIDRIDTNGNYEQSNCRWATRSEQARNKRNNVIVTAHGKAMLLLDWAEETNIPAETIRRRLRRGWTPERTVTTPLRPTKRRKAPLAGLA